MCGIAGLQGRPGTEIDPRVLDRLQASLRHRGPDSSGRYVSEATALVATRLAIVDLAHGDQPLVSPSGTILVANGEIYNAPELRQCFSGYPFRTHSDCEVIFPLFEAYGIDFAAHLRGMYAIALYDAVSGRLILARDTFGIKPLYLVGGEDGLAFASELSSLLDAGFCLPKIGERAEAELLQLKYVIGSKTIVPGIERLDPGETVVVEHGEIVQRHRLKIWDNRPEQGFPARVRGYSRSPQPLLDAFGQAIRDSVAVHLRADVPICLFYSGGIDSTILMLTLLEIEHSLLHALTVGYSGNEGVDESQAALALAREAGVACERIEMTSEYFWSQVPRIAAAIDDPMADPAVLPLYLLGGAAASRGYKVAVSGEGADEVFGGYSRYRRATLPGIVRAGRRRRGVFSKELAPAAQFDDWDEAIEREQQSQLSSWSTRLQAVQALDVIERLPNCLLIKLDRALMAHSVEGRTPFLDREMVDFAANVPDGLRANWRWTKRLLRDWLAEKCPQARPYEKKRGFGVPLASWLSEQAGALKELLPGHPAIAKRFDAAAVGRIVDTVAADAQPAWSLLFYALWHAHYILGIGCEGSALEVLSEARRAA